MEEVHINQEHIKGVDIEWWYTTNNQAQYDKNDLLEMITEYLG